MLRGPHCGARFKVQNVRVPENSSGVNRLPSVGLHEVAGDLVEVRGCGLQLLGEDVIVGDVGGQGMPPGVDRVLHVKTPFFANASEPGNKPRVSALATSADAI